MKPAFSEHILENKFKYQNPSKFIQRESSRSITTDGHDNANSRFSQFCEGT
jgi:hypothetical protein